MTGVTLRAIWTSMRVQWAQTTARAMMRFILLVSPVVHAALGAYMLYGRGDIEYAVVGTALINLWGAIIWSSGTDLIRERWMGNLEYLLIAPVSLFWSTLGKNLGNLLLGLGATLISVLCSRFLFGIPVAVARPGWLALALLAALFSFLALSLSLGSAVIFSRQSVSLMNGMDYPIYLLAGLMFPLDLLPAWTRPLSAALPLTWARQALSTAVQGGPAGRFWAGLLWMVALGALYALLARWLFRTVERKARERGELYA
ncbi:MAG: ABC transporter permease [Bacillota bacterium]